MEARGKVRLGIAAVIAVVLVVFLLLRCNWFLDDEALIRKAVGEIAAAAEDKDVGTILDYVHEDFNARQVRGRGALQGTLRVYFWQVGRISVTVDSVEIEFQEPGENGEGVKSAAVIIKARVSDGAMRTDLTIDATFLKEGSDWLVHRVDWSR